MSANHLIFSLFLVLGSTQLIHSQLLTLQNIPQWRSIVSYSHFRSFLNYLALSKLFDFFCFQFQPYPNDGLGNDESNK